MSANKPPDQAIDKSTGDIEEPINDVTASITEGILDERNLGRVDRAESQLQILLCEVLRETEKEVEHRPPGTVPGFEVLESIDREYLDAED
jgi:hypothetical protein